MPIDAPTAAEGKQERLQIRLDARDKAALQRAAGYRHESLSQFVLSTALEEATRIIRDTESVTLSDADWQAFFAALSDPPEPNSTLRDSYRRYRRSTG